MGFGIEEEQAALRVIRSGSLSGYQGNWSDAFWGGEEVKALECEWAQYFGVKHAIFCNSATSGLYIACAILNLKPKDEIIVAPYSMVCSASMPLNFGAIPIFADIEREYYCLDPASIESKITDNTKAVIVVNLFGMPADYDKINEICHKRDVTVIEDNAQGIGATYKGRFTGTLGDVGVFSLNRHKIINAGEGGIVVTNDDKLAFKARLILNHSESIINDIKRQGKMGDFENWNELVPLVGQNLRGTELTAAIAREQLKKLSGILKVYQDEAIHFPIKVRPECTSTFYKYAWMPDKIFDGLPVVPHDKSSPPYPHVHDQMNCAWYHEHLDFKFDIKQHYITPIYQMPLFRHLGYDEHLCPVCEEVEKGIVLAWFKNPI